MKTITITKREYIDTFQNFLFIKDNEDYKNLVFLVLLTTQVMHNCSKNTIYFETQHRINLMINTFLNAEKHGFELSEDDKKYIDYLKNLKITEGKIGIILSSLKKLNCVECNKGKWKVTCLGFAYVSFNGYFKKSKKLEEKLISFKDNEVIISFPKFN